MSLLSLILESVSALILLIATVVLIINEPSHKGIKPRDDSHLLMSVLMTYAGIVALYIQNI